MNIGVPELLLLALPLLVSYAVAFGFGFFMGKSIGFKQGLREPRR